MTWTKLDSDAIAYNQPLSAFIGKRLADNVNTYDQELTRASTFVYPVTPEGNAKVKWASFAGRRGTVVSIDVGNNASTFVFKVFYRTTNPALGGTIYVRDIDSGNVVGQTVPGSGTPVSATIPYATYGLRGVRGFHISFESELGDESVGSVVVNGAINNQVFCEPDGSAFPFTYAAGSFHEMYHVLQVEPGNAQPAPAGNALLRYQVCTFKHNLNSDRPPHGVLTVWPNVEVNPPILTTNTTTSGTKVFTSLYELGRLELYSITAEVSWPVSGTVRPPYVYQQPTSINRISNAIDSAMRNLQPDAATLMSSGGYLGRVLPAGEEATFAFFIQTNKSVQQLDVTFRAVAYNLIQNAPDITFGVRDYLGNTVGTDITQPSVPVPRITGQTSVEPLEGAAVFMNGVLAGDAKWGMRDAMPIEDALMSHPVRFTWGPNAQNDIAWGQDGATDAVYYGTISATSDLYIFGFNCRVL